MNQPAGEVVGLACSIWAAEVKALSVEGRIQFPVRYFDSMLHIYPERLACRLRTLVDEELSQRRRVILILGDCHAGMCEMASIPGVERVRGVNCCEILLGKTAYSQLLNEGAFFLLPEWTRKWRQVFHEALGLNDDGVRTLMREMVTRLVYLDTGLVPVPVEHLRAASEYTGLRYEILKVGLDNLASGIEDARRRLTGNDV
jgi:hypothetical protein